MATTAVSHSRSHCDNSNSTELESDAFSSSLSKMDSTDNSARGADGGKPVFHQKANGNKTALENRPKSGGKVLIRKNTPALLPKVDRICAKNITLNEPVLAEEEEEVDSKSTDVTSRPSQSLHGPAD